MSGRIDELYTLAKQQAGSDPKNSAVYQIFAELIIEDCVAVIEDTTDNTKSQWKKQYTAIVTAINDHFGVEE